MRVIVRNNLSKCFLIEVQFKRQIVIASEMERQLEPEQYEQILKYMEATNEENFEAATQTMKEYAFNLNTAINAKFNQVPQQNNRYQAPQMQAEDDEEIVRKFIQHMQKQNQNWSAFTYTYELFKGATLGLLKFIGEILAPEALLKKILRSRFYVLYRENSRLKFTDRDLKTMLLQTKEISSKACFMILSPPTVNRSVSNLLRNDEVIKKINANFMFAGFVVGDQQINHIANPQPPQVLICRYNIYKELDIVQRFTGEDAIDSISPQRLNQTIQECKNHHKRDKNVIIKYRNFLRRSYFGPMMPEEEEEEEINFATRQQVTHHIQEQNQQYKKIEEEALKRLQEQKIEKEKEEEQLHILQEKAEERKLRKMSIPDEPTEGEMIRCVFRCPDGSTKVRSFLADEQVELIYNWIETNEDIELEDNQKRQFEVLYSYPPQALHDKKQMKLREVFESDQEKLLIREL